MSRLYILFLTLALSFMPNASRAGEDDLTMRINQGNESFLSGKFNDAIKTYESIRADGFQNGYLSYNLGNAYFRVGNKGKAILNYLEAQSLLPREEEIRANLEFAIRKTEDRLAPEKENIVTSLLFWINDLSFKEHIHLALALHGLFWLAMILLYYRPTSAVDFTRKAVLGLFMLSICGLGARYYFNESKLNQNKSDFFSEPIDIKEIDYFYFPKKTYQT